jgi:hypothetical protein
MISISSSKKTRRISVTKTNRVVMPCETYTGDSNETQKSRFIIKEGGAYSYHCSIVCEGYFIAHIILILRPGH